jgi:hypothetical protein
MHQSQSSSNHPPLLWAVERGAPFTTGQVRPHELLNYFTFDTAASTGGAPHGEMGRVQAFATQERAELTRLRARVRGGEDLEFVGRRELATGPGR